MKKVFLVLLALACVLSMAACGNTDPEPTEPVTTQDPLTGESQQAEIVDGYVDVVEGCCFHIPQIRLGNVDMEQTNSWIHDTLYKQIKEGVYHAVDDDYSIYYTEMSYVWRQHDQVISLVVMLRYAANDLVDYYVYNISAVTGQLLTDDQIYEFLQMSEQSAQQRLCETLDHYWYAFREQNPDMDAQFVDALQSMTVSNENLRAAKPFLGADGKLWFAVNIYSVAGADYYTYLMDMQGNFTTIACQLTHDN